MQRAGVPADIGIPRDPDSREVLSEDEQEPYGMTAESVSVDQPIALLRKGADQS
ncbi:hypothetical protein ACFW7J_22890 [Streptomyces sp. NPDC059525]|uniref:hypothetical protein n=1 Tax=Streptomyces sp. NPDC059525 TaxID=3346857 RepID=UPI0036852D36